MVLNNMLPLAAEALLTDTDKQRQPYYLVPAVFSCENYETRKVASLCSLLNQSGFESYIVGTQAHGQFWAPMLTPFVQAEHFKAKRKPIVLNANTKGANPLKLGKHIRIAADEDTSAVVADVDCAVSYGIAPICHNGSARMVLPLPEAELFISEPGLRQSSLLYTSAYTGLLQPEHLDLEKIDADFGDKLDRLAKQLGNAKILYLYEWSDLAVFARMCGCAVVLVPNQQCLAQDIANMRSYGSPGLAIGQNTDAIDKALAEVAGFNQYYRAQVSGWQSQMLQFAEETQQLADALDFELCWPQATTDTLPGIYTEAKDLADRADRLKWSRLHGQYKQWSTRSTLREIDAQIYAEHLVAGRTAAVSILIDQRSASLDALADTLDSLSSVLGQPAIIYIVSRDDSPEGFETSAMVKWVKLAQSHDMAWLGSQIPTTWLLLLRAGTLLTPRSLMEWMLAPQTYPLAKLIYADEDVHQADGTDAYPFFKPDINVELLRCTNYLGDAVLLNTATWRSLAMPLFDGELYAAALRLLARQGRSSFAHLDGVLFHASSAFCAETESAEFESVCQVLKNDLLCTKIVPLPRWGTWLVQYANPVEQRVSMVIPTGLQTGYLRGLLLGIERCPAAELDEIILVCAANQRAEVQSAVTGICLPTLRIVTHAHEIYSHSAALNTGVREARNNFVLIADDDAEPLHKDWLSPLLGIMAQPDVGCVAPRLLNLHGKETKVVGGPLILGVSGTFASYTGEAQWVDESGTYSRLQLTQDVSAVAGHCFMLRRSDWERVGGVDEQQFQLFFPVLDFCLKLGALGKRHVWTPLVGYLHHGGKTMEVLRRNIKSNIELADSELKERIHLHAAWSVQLANDPSYNRHLSLTRPFDIEADIVIDWQPKRPDRPRVLAVPLHSGAGQYRVIEPLNALQDAGLAQTSVVMPLAHSQHRLLQPLELLRAAPDRLILQHSVDDGQLALIDSFKRVAPHIKIVQMVDDLFGEVPEKHPGRQFQAREGHQRMMQALTLSDRMVVTTQPLVEYYKKYIQDVHIVPNTLAQQWQGLYKEPVARKKLRVGWVGAAQHKGDLDLITDVVRELASEVDWVFMGMCTDEIRPYLKEFHSFVSIAEYPKKMASLDLDIAVAPLENNIFNRCKSNLRLLEYGAIGWPVVCSDVYPYRSNDPPVLHAQDLKTDWIKKIRSLYDFETRKLFSEKLNEWVRKSYTLDQQVLQWRDALFDAEAPSDERSLSLLQRHEGRVDSIQSDLPQICVISASKLTQEDFWLRSALGLSLTRLMRQGESIQIDIAFENTRGLPEIFNEAVTRAPDAAVLVFIHDDVWIDEDHFSLAVVAGLTRFDVIGVAGNKRRVPGQPGWCFVNEAFAWDEKTNLSGRVGHGVNAFGVVSDFGEVPAACELLDGVFLAVRKHNLMQHQVQFDGKFDFHFYDLDFCRTARQAGLQLGTWGIQLTHQSGGAFGMPNWQEMYKVYCDKWHEPLPIGQTDRQYTNAENANNKLQLEISNALDVALQCKNSDQIEQAESIYIEILKIDAKNSIANHGLAEIEALYKDSMQLLPMLEAAVCEDQNNEQYWVSYIDLLSEVQTSGVVEDAIELASKFGFDVQNKLNSTGQTKAEKLSPGELSYLIKKTIEINIAEYSGAKSDDQVDGNYRSSSLDLALFSKRLNIYKSNNQQNDILDLIHRAVLQLKLVKDFVGVKTLTPYFDTILEDIDFNITNIVDRSRKISNLVIASEVYDFGGHTKVVQDILNAVDNPVLIITDIYNRFSGSNFFINEKSFPANCPVLILPPDSLEKRARGLANFINLFAKNVFLLSHHDDPIPMAGCQKNIDTKYYFVHHADHNPALGNMIKHFHHIDLFSKMVESCSNLLNKKIEFLPITASDLGEKKFTYPIQCYSTVTAGSFGKFTTEGELSLINIIKVSMRVCHGKHFHFGYIPDEYIDVIRANLVVDDLDPERFVYMGNVPTLWGSLLEIDAHIYLGSAPIGGGKANTEAQGSGYPLLIYKDASGPIHLNLGNQNDSALLWSTMDELKNNLLKVMQSHRENSFQSRQFYLQHCNFDDFRKKLTNLCC